MSLLRKSALAAGAVIFTAVVGVGGYTALGYKMPGAQDCPGGIAGASIGGPFELTDKNGARVGSETLKGAPSLVYFGYGTCPDVCPMELSEISGAVDLLADHHDLKVQSVFVTIDPERDTPAKVGEYASFFHDDMIGLTGTPEEIAKTAKAFKVFYQRVDDPDFADGYSMNHTDIIYLLDEKAEYRSYYKGREATPESLAEAVSCHFG